jgi:tetraacyldisaccharide 4'-kinase
MRGVLSCLAYAYSAGLKVYLFPYRIGVRKQTALVCPVVSVGNLTVGGTGKTPMTRLVCEIFAQNGLKPCVLSRGYKGKNEFGAAIVSTESRVELNASEAGDEAYMLARALPGVPVVVGKDRRKTGALAWDRFKPDVIVLDDGMQFYQLHRDLDIVMIDGMRPFDNGWTFPRGLLREPPSHLGRAGCVVITNADKVTDQASDALADGVQRLAGRAHVTKARYEARALRPADGTADLPISWMNGKKVATFCALGHPEAFEKQVADCGADIVHSARRDDHVKPTIADLNAMIQNALERGAEAVIISEKDSVKLPPIARPLPFLALKVSLRLDDESSFRELLMRAVQA